mmetsp:Transcript_27863/g.88949  ORF Transcript_27863/g.88949 Transcript_27863/m.88949 type:complete len:253 (+) Transcript_27863:158-916(+)
MMYTFNLHSGPLPIRRARRRAQGRRVSVKASSAASCLRNDIAVAGRPRAVPPSFPLAPPWLFDARQLLLQVPVQVGGIPPRGGTLDLPLPAPVRRRPCHDRHFILVLVEPSVIGGDIPHLQLGPRHGVRGKLGGGGEGVQLLLELVAQGALGLAVHDELEAAPPCHSFRAAGSTGRCCQAPHPPARQEGDGGAWAEGGCRGEWGEGDAAEGGGREQAARETRCRPAPLAAGRGQGDQAGTKYSCTHRERVWI